VSGAAVEQSQTRNDFLDAAEQLFYGIQAVSMDQIRAECGLTLKRS
jgi:AcrR family transcriptional regulator